MKITISGWSTKVTQRGPDQTNLRGSGQEAYVEQYVVTVRMRLRPAA
jgi:hypothetical protein